MAKHEDTRRYLCICCVACIALLVRVEAVADRTEFDLNILDGYEDVIFARLVHSQTIAVLWNEVVDVERRYSEVG